MNRQQAPLVGYETANPNEYQWTQLAYRALTDGSMTADIVGAAGSRRATVRGPCPRCGHEIHFDQLLDAVAGEDGGIETLGSTIDIAAEKYLELVVSCRCTEAHDKRPDGVTCGCGINFRVDVLDTS